MCWHGGHRHFCCGVISWKGSESKPPHHDWANENTLHDHFTLHHELENRAPQPSMPWMHVSRGRKRPPRRNLAADHHLLHHPVLAPLFNL